MFLNDLQNRLQPTAVPTIVHVSNPPKLVTDSCSRRKRTYPSDGSNMQAAKRRKSGNYSACLYVKIETSGPWIMVEEV